MCAVKRLDRVLREALCALVGLELILAYFYLLDMFNPRYEVLLHGVVWGGEFRLGLADQGLQGLIPILAVSLLLNAYPYLAKSKSGGWPIFAHMLLAASPLLAGTGFGWLPALLSGLSVSFSLEDGPRLLAEVGFWVLAILTGLELLALLSWVAYLWDPSLPYLAVKPPYRRLLPSELRIGLFDVWHPVYPLLVMSTLYVWTAPLAWRLIRSRVRVHLKLKPHMVIQSSDDLSRLAKNLRRKLCLTVTLLLAVLLPLIPYLPSINPNFKPASVDIRYYSKWLSEMLIRDHWSAIDYAFYGAGNGNRPLYLLLLYGLTNLGIPKELVLNLEAVYIAPFYALAVYYAAKRLSGNAHYALLASLAGILGFNMTVGMMAGFFAAWTATALFYLCVGLTHNLRGCSPWGLASYLMASTAMLYIHPWTWSLLMAALTLHLTLSALDSLKNGRLEVDKRLFTILAVNGSVDLFKTLTSPKYGGLKSSADVVMGLGFKHLLQLPSSLQRLTVSYVAGLFYNPLHTLLALIGILSLAGRRGPYPRLILIWLAIISLVFPLSDVGLQSHLLFAAPFPILIAEGLWAASSFAERFNPKLPKALIAFFSVSSLTYTVRALCNLV